MKIHRIILALSLLATFVGCKSEPAPDKSKPRVSVSSPRATNSAPSREAFTKALALDPDRQWAKQQLAKLPPK